MYINSDIWWSFGKGFWFYRSYSGDPYRLELQINSLLISVDKVVHMTARRMIENDWTMTWQSKAGHRGVYLYVDRPCRSFNLDLLQPSQVKLFDADSDNPDVDIDGRTYWNHTFCAELSILVLWAHNLGDYHEPWQRRLYLYIIVNIIINWILVYLW